MQKTPNTTNDALNSSPAQMSNSEDTIAQELTINLSDSISTEMESSVAGSIPLTANLTAAKELVEGYLKSIGRNAIKLPVIAEGLEAARASVTSFEQGLLQVVQQRRATSGNPKVQEEVRNQQKRMQSMSYDVENTYYPGSHTANIVSYSYIDRAPGEKPVKQTIVPKGWEAEVDRAIAEHSSVGRGKDVEFFKTLRERIKAGVSDKSYTVVPDSEFATKVASTFPTRTNAASTVLMGYNSQTTAGNSDVSKLYNLFKGSQVWGSNLSIERRDELNGRNPGQGILNQTVDLSSWAKSYLGFTSGQKGWSLSSIGQRLGVLPKTIDAHEGMWDTEVTDSIGAIKLNIEQSQKTVNSGGKRSPLHELVREQLSTDATPWRETVLAEAVAQDIGKLRYGTHPIYKDGIDKVSVDDVGSLAHARYESFVNTGTTPNVRPKPGVAPKHAQTIPMETIPKGEAYLEKVYAGEVQPEKAVLRPEIALESVERGRTLYPEEQQFAPAGSSDLTALGKRYGLQFVEEMRQEAVAKFNSGRKTGNIPVLPENAAKQLFENFIDGVGRDFSSLTVPAGGSLNTTVSNQAIGSGIKEHLRGSKQLRDAWSKIFAAPVGEDTQVTFEQGSAAKFAPLIAQISQTIGGFDYSSIGLDSSVKPVINKNASYVRPEVWDTDLNPTEVQRRRSESVRYSGKGVAGRLLQYAEEANLHPTNRNQFIASDTARADQEKKAQAKLLSDLEDARTLIPVKEGDQETYVPKGFERKSKDVATSIALQEEVAARSNIARGIAFENTPKAVQLLASKGYDVLQFGEKDGKPNYEAAGRYGDIEFHPDILATMPAVSGKYARNVLVADVKSPQRHIPDDETARSLLLNQRREWAAQVALYAVGSGLPFDAVKLGILHESKKGRAALTTPIGLDSLINDPSVGGQLLKSVVNAAQNIFRPSVPSSYPTSQDGLIGTDVNLADKIALVDTNLKLPTPKIPYTKQEQGQVAQAKAQASNTAFDSLHKHVNALIAEAGTPEKAAAIVQDRSNSWFEKHVGDNLGHMASLVDAFGDIGLEDAYRPKLAAAIRTYTGKERTKDAFTSAFRSPSAEAVDSTEAMEKKLQEQMVAKSAREVSRKERIAKLNSSHDAVLQQMRENGILLRGGFTDENVAGTFTNILGPKQSKSVGGEAHLRDAINEDPWFIRPGAQSVFSKAEEAKNVVSLIRGHKRGASQAWLTAQNLVMEGEATRVAGPETTNEYIKSLAVPSPEGAYKLTLDKSLGKMAYHQTELNSLGKLQPTYEAVIRLLDKQEKALSDTVDSYVNSAVKLLSTVQSTKGATKGAALHDYGQAVTKLQSVGIDVEKLGLPFLAPASKAQKEGFDARAKEVTQTDRSRARVAAEAERLPIDQQYSQYSKLQRNYDAAKQQYQTAISGMAVIESTPEIARTEAQNTLYKRLTTQKANSYEAMQVLQPQMTAVVRGESVTATSKPLGEEELKIFTSTQELIASQIKATEEETQKTIKKHVDNALKLKEKIAAESGQSKGAAILDYQVELNSLSGYNLDLKQLGLTKISPVNRLETEGYDQRNQAAQQELQARAIARNELSTSPIETILSAEQRSKQLTSVQKKYDAAQYNFLAANSNVAVLENIPTAVRTDEQSKLLEKYKTQKNVSFEMMRLYQPQMEKLIGVGPNKLDTSEASKAMESFQLTNTVIERQSENYLKEVTKFVDDNLREARKIAAQIGHLPASESRGKLMQQYNALVAPLQSHGIDLNSLGLATYNTDQMVTPDLAGYKRQAQANMVNNMNVDAARTRLETTSGDSLHGMDAYSKHMEGLQGRLVKTDLSAQFAKFATERLTGVDTDEARKLKADYGHSYEKSILESSLLNQFISENKPAPVAEPMLSPSETALKSVKDNRTATLEKHVNTALLAQTEAETFGLTPELFKTIATSTAAIRNLGGSSQSHGIDIGKLATMVPSELIGSKSLYSIDAAMSGDNTDPFNLSKNQDTYIKQLDTAIEQSKATKVEDPFIRLGKEIEHDIQLVNIYSQELKKISQSTPEGAAEYNRIHLLKKGVQTRIEENREKLDGNYQSQRQVLDSYKYDDSRVAAGATWYEDYQVQKRSAIISKAEQLQAIVGGGGYSPEISAEIVKLSKLAKKEGAIADFSKVINIEDLVHSAAVAPIQGKMTKSMTGFVTNAQVMNSAVSQGSITGLGGVDIFDAMYQKERAALATVNELKTALAECGNVSLGTVDQEFNTLGKEVQGNITKLHDLQSMIRSTGITPTAAMNADITQLKQSITSGVTRLDILRKDMRNQRPGFTKDVWTARQADVADEREREEFDLLVQAQAANARIADGKGSYKDYKKAHDIAKEIEDRGVDPTTFGLNWEKDGVFSRKQVEGVAKENKKPYFGDQHHVTFTEQLVDLANWQLQWAGATAVIQGFSAALYGGFGAAREFESQMKDVELIMQANNRQMQAVEATIVKLGSNFKVPVKELAEGLVILGQAGYGATESMQMIQPISQLAVATRSTHAQASDITTSVMMAYDQPAFNAKDITNTLAAATIESKLELGSIGTTFNYIASTASQAGLSLEETATAMGLMSNAGVRASTIGTSLRSILGVFLAPTDRFKAELGRVGVSTDELNPRTHDIQSILTRLNTSGFSVENAFEGMSKREAGAMTALLSQADKWGSFKSKITGTDRAETMAVGQMDTFDAQVKRLQNVATLTGVSVYGGSMTPLKIGTKLAADGMEWISKLAGSDTGKAVTQIVSLGTVAMTTATLLTTIGKAGVLLGPAALRGIKSSFGVDVPYLQQDPRRSKITSGIESMAGLVFNPLAAGLAVGALGLTYGLSKVTAGDTLFGMDTSNWFGGSFNKGTAPLAKETAKVEYAANLVTVLDTAAKQEEQLKVAYRGTGDAERRAMLESLVTSGFYVGKDRNNRLVTAERFKEGAEVSDLVGGIDGLNLKAVQHGAAYYKSRYAENDYLKQVMETGNRSFGDDTAVHSKEGLEYVQFASDRLTTQAKAKGIYYDSAKMATFLNTQIEGSVGNAAIGRAVRQAVLEKQETAMLAPDKDIAEADMAKTTFKETMQQIIDVRKAADTTDSSNEAIRLREGFKKQAIFTELAHPEVDAALQKDSVAKAAITKAQVRIQEAKTPEESDKAIADLLRYLEELSSRPGLEKLNGITNKVTSRTAEAISPKAIAELNTTAQEAYDTYLLKNPDKASRAEYSTAKVKFTESTAVKVNRYTEMLKEAEAAQSQLASMSLTDPGYSEQARKVSMYKMSLEELDATMKSTYQNSLKYSMSGVESKLRLTLMDLSFPAQFASEDLQQGKGTAFTAIPTVAMTDFRKLSTEITGRYAKILQEPTIAGDENLTKRVRLAMKLEIEDTEEAILAKAGQKIKDTSDKIASTYARDALNVVAKINIDAEIATLKVDMVQSALKEKLTTAAPVKLQPSEPAFTGIDWSERGLGYYGPTPTYTESYQKAPIFTASQYSADTMFLESIKAEAEKNQISRTSNHSTFEANSLAAYQAYRQKMSGIYAVHNIESVNELPETPASAAQSQWEVIGKGQQARLIERAQPVEQSEAETAKVSSAAKKELLAQEQEYTATRISNSTKELQAITKNIQSEIALRDKLLDKMRELQDGAHDAQRGIDRDVKDLLKGAGIDTKSNPNDMISDLLALRTQMTEYADKGQLDKFNKALGSAREIKSDMTAKGYAPSYLKQAADIFDSFKGLESHAREVQYTSYQTQVTASNERQAGYVTSQSEQLNNIRDAIGSDKSLTSSERSVRLEEFDRRVAANKNDPGMMQELIKGYENNPHLTKEITGIEAYKELNKALLDLTQTVGGLSAVFLNLRGKDVTPGKSSLKELLGEGTVRELGLENGTRGPAIREVENLTTANGAKANALYMNGEILYTKGANRQTIAHEMAHYAADIQHKKFYPKGNTAEQKMIEEAWADDVAGKDVQKLYGLRHGFNPETITPEDVSKVKRSYKGSQYWKEYSGARAELAEPAQAEEGTFDHVRRTISNLLPDKAPVQAILSPEKIRPNLDASKQVLPFDESNIRSLDTTGSYSRFLSPEDRQAGLQEYKKRKSRLQANRYDLKSVYGRFQKEQDIKHVELEEASPAEHERLMQDSYKEGLAFAPIGPIGKMASASKSFIPKLLRRVGGQRAESAAEVVEHHAIDFSKSVTTEGVLAAPSKLYKKGADFVNKYKWKATGAVAVLGAAGYAEKQMHDAYKRATSDRRLKAMDSAETKTAPAAPVVPAPKAAPKAAQAEPATPARMSIEDYTTQASKWLAEAHKKELLAAENTYTPSEELTNEALTPVPVTMSDVRRERSKQAKRPLSDIGEAMSIWNSIHADTPEAKEKNARRLFKKRHAAANDIDNWIDWGKNSDTVDQARVADSKGPKEGGPANPLSNNIGSEAVPPAGIIRTDSATRGTSPLTESPIKPLTLSLGKERDKEFRRLIGRPTVGDKAEDQGTAFPTLVASADKDITAVQKSLRSSGENGLADRFDGITVQNRALDRLRAGGLEAAGPRYELDSAEQAPAGTADSLLASNEKLTQALDNLRTVLEKTGTNGQSTTTENGAAAKSTASVGVSVTIPITVESGEGASPEKVGPAVEKVCRDFFDKEFGTRFVQACNTVNIS